MAYSGCKLNHIIYFFLFNNEYKNNRYLNKHKLFEYCISIVIDFKLLVCIYDNEFCHNRYIINIFIKIRCNLLVLSPALIDSWKPRSQCEHEYFMDELRILKE